MRAFWFALRVIDGGISGRVDNNVGSNIGDGAFDRWRAADIEGGPADGTRRYARRGWRGFEKTPGDLSVRTCNEEPHWRSFHKRLPLTPTLSPLQVKSNGAREIQ